jgi:hypothetical protein
MRDAGACARAAKGAGAGQAACEEKGHAGWHGGTFVRAGGLSCVLELDR